MDFKKNITFVRFWDHSSFEATEWRDSDELPPLVEVYAVGAIAGEDDTSLTLLPFHCYLEGKGFGHFTIHKESIIERKKLRVV